MSTMYWDVSSNYRITIAMQKIREFNNEKITIPFSPYIIFYKPTNTNKPNKNGPTKDRCYRPFAFTCSLDIAKARQGRYKNGRDC